jgi:hypothetical protein
MHKAYGSNGPLGEHGEAYGGNTKGIRRSILGEHERRENIYINIGASRENLVVGYFDPGSSHEDLEGSCLRLSKFKGQVYGS